MDPTGYLLIFDVLTTAMQRFIRILILSIGIGSTAHGQLIWVEQNSGTNVFLHACDFVNTVWGYAAGDEGTILLTEDGGDTWFTQSSGTTQLLRDIHFFDADKGWAVGDSGVVLRTTNGGSTWSSQYLGATTHFESISFINASTGWIAGTDTLTDLSVLYKTTDGGITWAPTGTPVFNGFLDIDFLDSNNGYAASVFYAYFTSNGGLTWNLISTPSASQINRIDMLSATEGWILAGTGQIFHTTTGLTGWANQTTGTTNFLWGLAPLNSNTLFVAGHGSTILRTTNGGLNWTPQTGSFENLLVGLSAVDETTAWVCGKNGKIYRSYPHVTDAEITSYEGPDTVCYDADFTVQVNVKNGGLVPIDSLDFVVTDGTETLLTYHWEQTLNPGDVSSFSLGTVSRKNDGLLIISMTGDSVIANNSFTTPILLYEQDAHGTNGPLEACSGEEIELSAYGGSAYYWLNAGTDSTAQTQEITAFGSGTYFVRITQNHCNFIDSALVSVISNGCNTNAFSPNGDGKNDAFLIDQLPDSDNRVFIYNRWGDALRQFENYDNSTVVWDGRDSGGNMLPEGVYYYTVETTAGAHSKGWVSIVR